MFVYNDTSVVFSQIFCFFLSFFLSPFFLCSPEILLVVADTWLAEQATLVRRVGLKEGGAWPSSSPS